jgi:DNA modification methylase
MEANDWFPTIKDESVQLFVLDPPYNVGYGYNTFKDRKKQSDYIAEQVDILNQCSKKLVEGGSIFYLNYPESAADVWANVNFLTRFEIITWIYNVHSSGSPVRKATRSWLWFSKGNPLINQSAFDGEYQNPTDKRVAQRIKDGFKPAGYDWWEFQQVKNVSKEKRDHPCQLPEAMVSKIILGASNPGDLVCDVYSGSGTTAVAAIKNGRKFDGCDLDKKYVTESNAFLKTLK